MEKKNIPIVFLVLFKTCAGSKWTLPVLMMDHDGLMSNVSIKANPFETMPSDVFLELASNALTRATCVVIFIEDTFCTEDLSSKDSLGSPFYNLQKGIQDKKTVYMPAVTEPYHLLRQVFELQDKNVFHVGAGETMNIQKNIKYVYVYFEDDDNMERIDKLRNHDKLITEIYFAVSKVTAGSVLAFYTGVRNPITLAQLSYSSHEFRAQGPERGKMVETPEALFRLTGVSSSVQSRRASFEDTPVVEHEMRTRSGLTTTMLVTDFHLQFNFEFGEHKWSLANVALLEAGEEVGRTETAIEAPWRRSYHCSQPITILNLRDGSAITISEYQIEPMFESRRSSHGADSTVDKLQDKDWLSHSDSSGDSPTITIEPTTPTPTPGPGRCFSHPVNCAPYFNPVILSGLMVTFLFVSITFWGVIMLFNCGRNSKFDNPNQKPLAVAQESGGGGI